MPLDQSVEAVKQTNAGLQELVERRTRELVEVNRALQAQIDRHKQSERIITAQRDLGFLLAGASTVTEALRLCLETAIRLSDLDCGGIYMVDPFTGALHLACIQGVSTGFADQVRDASADSDRVRRAMLNRAAYLDRDSLRAPEFEDIRREGISAVAMIPISGQTRVIGVLNAATHRLGDIPPESRIALEIIATQIGVSIQRAQADNALRASEKRFRDLADLLPQPVFECNEQGDVTFANLMTSEVFGYSVEDLREGIKNIGKVFLPEDADKIAAHLTRLRNGQKVGPAELALQRKDGSTFPAIVFADPILRDNRIAGFRGTLIDITERHRTEAVLRESESKFRDLAEKSVAGIYLVQDGIFKYANARFAEILGYDTGEVTGVLRAEEAIFPDDWPTVRENLRRRISGELESLLYEFRIRRKNGEVRNAEVYSSRTTYLGKPAVIGTLLDVTERRQAQKALQESEEKYRNIFENAIEGIFQTSPEGRFISINPSLARMAGYDSPQEMIGSINNLEKQLYVHPGERIRCMKLLDDVESVEKFEVQFYRKDGSIIWTSLNVRKVYDEKGKLAHYEGAAQDITRSKEAELALQESEAKYRGVVESSLVGFYIAQDNILRFVNQRFCDVTGYSYDEIVDVMSPLDIIHPEDRSLVAENVARRLAGHEKQIEYSFRVVRKDGRVITVKVFGNSIIYRGRMAICGTAIDITREKTMEAQLHQSQRMEAIGTLAGGIAHDFNNILGGIIGYAGLAQLKTSDSRIKPYLERILGACDRAKDLVTQILTFSRQKDHEKKPLSVTPVVKEALKLIRSSLPATVEIRLSYENCSDTVLADATQIHRVLINLCANAAHAMRERGGLLDIHLSRLDVTADPSGEGPLAEGSYLKLVVKDTGHGIDPAVMDKIFDPFYTTKGPGEGTGLGLSMVYGIVKNHDGTISVSSKPGEGTTFTICLPLIDVEEKPQERAMEEIPVGREHILYVDDEELLASIGKEMLAFLGYTVTVRFSSLDALEAFRANPNRFDLVVTDTTMPNMTGGVLAAELLKMRPGLPIILTSGFSEKMNEEEAKRIGVKEFIMKPISLDSLARTVRRVLDQAQAAGNPG
jgi:PAS domain S-box-containing protein